MWKRLALKTVALRGFAQADAFHSEKQNMSQEWVVAPNYLQGMQKIIQEKHQEEVSLSAIETIILEFSSLSVPVEAP